MSTLTEIAKELGISVSSINHVVNNRAEKVGAATRKRIEDALIRHNYRTNSVAHALRTGRSHTLGIIVPSVRFGFFPEIIDAVEREARGRGYQILIGQSHSDADTFRQQCVTMRQRWVDGLLLIPPRMDATVLKRLGELSVPFVLIDGHVDDPAIAFVDVDDADLTRTATGYLLANGHERIGFISGRQAESADGEARKRRDGYADAMRRAGHAPRIATLDTEEYAIESGEAGVHRLLADFPDLTAVVAPTDMTAIGALRALNALGRRVPEDMSLMGCGDIREGQYLQPGLTTVSQHADAMGRMACQALLDHLEQPDACPPTGRWLEPEVIVRQSVAPARR